MSDGHLEEFLTIVTRDLGAQSAIVLDDVGHDGGPPQASQAPSGLGGGAGAEAPGNDRGAEAVAANDGPGHDVAPADAAEDAGLTLSCELPGGRRLVVRFAAPPADAEALRRRLMMLASAFGDVLPHDPRPRASRPPPARSLHEELAALATRSGALEAVVIDANSPVIWGAAGDAGSADDAPSSDALPDLPRSPAPRPSGLHDITGILRVRAPGGEGDASPVPPPVSEPRSPSPPPEPSLAVEPIAPAGDDEGDTAALTERALLEVRALPDLAGLHRGGHLRHMVSEPAFGYVARSFAAIYVIVVVFDRPFEELLAKRAITQALPTIERLVAALPPLDPRPTAGVAALRGRRRR